MWNAARACTQRDFLNNIKDIAALDPSAYAWLKKFKSTVWLKHAHNPTVKCDMLLNNLTETFNAYIGEARDKPT